MTDKPDNGDDKLPHLVLVPKDGSLSDSNGSGVSGFWEQVDAECYRRDMEAVYDRWQAGDLTAFNTAMLLAWRRSPEAFPRELLRMGEALVERAMSEDEKSARRDFAMHRDRWEMVEELRERHEELTQRSRSDLEQAEAALMTAIKTRDIKERDRLYGTLPELRRLAKVDYGSNLDAAQETVAEALSRAGPKPVGQRAVRESYDIIRVAGGANATYESFLKERERRWGLRRRRGQPRDEPEE